MKMADVEKMLKASATWRENGQITSPLVMSLSGCTQKEATTTLNALYNRNEVHREGEGKYRRYSLSAYWVSDKWGRTHTNAELMA